MTIFDLLFLASFFFLVVCLVAIALSALRSRGTAARRWLKILLWYFAVYVAALLLTSLFTPRRIYAPGQRRCWDDWCATAVSVAPGLPAASSCSALPNARLWLAEIQVSSVAKRIRQRARDARAELEDQHGSRYSPCAAPLAWRPAPSSPPAGLWHELSDPLGPGDSFTVLLPFQLPSDRQPSGIVLNHGGSLGLLIIGSDPNLFHGPALQRVSVSP